MPFVAEIAELLGVANPTAEELSRAYPGGFAVDDPDGGRIAAVPGSTTALARFLADSSAWLAGRSAHVMTGPVTNGDRRTVAEFDLELAVDGSTFVLPLAVAIEPGPDRSVAVRIYHSHWPLLGRHVVRPPLLARDPNVRESDVVGRYQAALAAGDTDAIAATFEDDGCFREPAGPQYRVCGRDNLRPFFAGFFSLGGGIVLEHCTVTEDGVRTALEFNALRWGTVYMPPQAGIAVYERGATGRLAHARIYDDVDPPLD